jgi:hypothetical protein
MSISQQPEDSRLQGNHLRRKRALVRNSTTRPLRVCRTSTISVATAYLLGLASVKINSPETIELLLESMGEFIRAQRETIHMIDQLQRQVDTLSAQSTLANDALGPDLPTKSSNQKTQISAAEPVHTAEHDCNTNETLNDDYEPDLPPMYPCADQDHRLESCDGSQVHRLIGGLHGEMRAYRNLEDDPTDSLPILNPIVSAGPTQGGALPYEEAQDQAVQDDDPSDPEWAAAHLSNTEPATSDPVHTAP